MSNIGYARVSTREQNLCMQIVALQKFGCEKMVKTEDIHPPKTGISVHFCVLSLMAMQK